MNPLDLFSFPCFAIGTVIGTLFGILLSAVLRHWLAKRRDVDKERRGAVRQFRNFIDRVALSLGTASNSRNPKIIMDLRNFTAEFEAQISMVGDHLSGRDRRHLDQAAQEYREFYRQLKSPSGTGRSPSHEMREALRLLENLRRIG